MIPVKEFIKENRLVFDGAMGTYFAKLNKKIGAGCELANLSDPFLIQQIHKEYIEAGCNAIKTNTFNVNRITMQMDEELVEKVIEEAIKNASMDSNIYVFGDIGPIDSLHAFEEYQFVVDIFLKNGISNFIFETNANTNGLKEISEYIKEKNPDAFIICSFAIQPDGYSKEGIHIHDIFEELKTCESIDSLGMNCVCGAYHMAKLVQDLDVEDICLSLIPNAGYPIVLNNRTFYDGNPEYYAMQMVDLAKKASIIGGCCGTTPDHIKEVIKSLGNEVESKVDKKVSVQKEIHDSVSSSFWNKLQNREKVMAVELDPPDHSSLTKFMMGAWQLKGAGVDILTIADCPVGRVRMDSSLLACKIQRELGLEALPHMTCRDRNINATKALLMGVYAEGIRNVLLITGDPIPSVQRDEVKSVYQFNSRMLASYISSMEKRQVLGSFHLFGALNVNAFNFDVQLKFAKEKLKNGMVGFLTQPILTEKAFENLKKARQELDCFILGGVIPVVSKRNAMFMDSEIQGINVDPKIIELYDGKNREESEALAIDISCRIMKDIEDYVDGFYLMTPFGRTALMEKIIKTYNEK